MLGSGKSTPQTQLDFSDSPPKIAIICANYFKDISDALIDGARSALRDIAGEFEIIEVPGVMELPSALRIAINTGRFDGFVVLGAVMDGDTGEASIHDQTNRAIVNMAAEGHCIGAAVLIADTRKALLKLASIKKGDVGGDAALAALQLIALSRRLNEKPSGMGFKPASEHILIASRDEPKNT